MFATQHPEEPAAIRVSGLTKRFSQVVAVDNVSLTVPVGSVFAFLGRNGAGKSSTIGCLTTAWPFDQGDVEVAGHDVAREGASVRRRIGVVFQESLLDPSLTVRENLTTRARFYGSDSRAIASRTAELSDLIQLEEFLDRRYSDLSGGQRRRADIARALLHGPSVLFLDEPTAGLDPASRAVVWRTLHELNANAGLTVFLTTHYMEETEQADRVCVIDAGAVIAEGTPTELRSQHSRSVLTITTRNPAGLQRLVSAAARTADASGDIFAIPVDDADAARRLLIDHGDDVADFEFRHGRMDDVFLALTGSTTSDGLAP
ncbi:ABC transporter ATP-binding protein [Microbacterium sp. R1]|nr:ABC transporter ATP-binding protein [Microbacterium sp. R1]